MTNRPNGTLHTGVTSDIGRRAYEHREGLVKGFTKRYGLKRLVHIEFYETISAAIQRESNMKHWPRAWKAPTSAPKNLHCPPRHVWQNCDTAANHGRNRVKSLTLRSRQRSLFSVNLPR